MLIVVAGIGCASDDDSPPRSAKEIVLERFPECAGNVDEGNPTVKGKVIQFNCGIEFDGPAYYLDARTGALICTCRMVCEGNCPPAEFRLR